MSYIVTLAADVDAIDDAGLRRRAERLALALSARGLRLAVAESCTGGWIAKALTDLAGSSGWFESGYVTYSNRAKIDTLDVSPETLAKAGAVSAAVVAEMTAGTRRISGADAAIAVSGVAGPDGGTPAKPVGLVFFGFSVLGRDWTERAEFRGDREAVRRAAVAHALDTLRKALAS